MIQKSLFKLSCSIFKQKKTNKIIFAARLSSESKKSKANKTKKAPKEQEPSEDQNGNVKFSSFVLASVSVTTFCLGVWQIKKAYDKACLIKSYENCMKSETCELPIEIKDYDSFVKENEYKPFKVKGYFLNSNEIILSPRHDLTQTFEMFGGYVITPFVLSKDPTKIILVNRGFVPYNRYSQNSRKESLIEDEIELTGILRSNQPEIKYTSKNRPPNEWHRRNIKEMSESLKTAPIFLDQVKTKLIPNSPIGGQTEVDLKNDHFFYILTCLGISSVSTFLWVKLAVRRLF